MNTKNQLCLYTLIGLTMTGLFIAAPSIYGQTSSENQTLAKANSTSLLPSEITIKKASIFSILTVTPWVGKVNQNIEIQGKLMEPFTGKDLAGQTIKLDAALISVSMTPLKKIQAPPATTDQQGNFKFNIKADKAGLIKLATTFSGNQAYYPAATVAAVSVFP